MFEALIALFSMENIYKKKTTNLQNNFYTYIPI